MKTFNGIPFRTQFDKIVGAYLRNELNPTHCEACFVGNLLNNKADWSGIRDVRTGEDPETFNRYYHECQVQAHECIKVESEGMYTPQEIYALENIFLKEIGHLWNGRYYSTTDHIENYEDKLFKAMEVTLEALKQLHIQKGEVVNSYVFSKRVLGDSVKVTE